MENTADHLIVIGRGKLIADCPMAEFIADGTALAAVVKTPDDQLLAAKLAASCSRAVTRSGELGLPRVTAIFTPSGGWNSPRCEVQ
jgi:ABC-2 type transport system ATP-binding protein